MEINKGCWGRWCARLMIQNKKLKAENQSLHDQITQMENERLKINKQVTSISECVHIIRGLL